MKASDSRFRDWLLRETGIDPDSLGNDFLSRALAERVHALQHADGERLPSTARTPVTPDALDAYWQHLNASADERRALIELFVVPETWFFRDREAFATLARLAAERIAAAPTRVIRVLSAPCSTGEEPYSAAMALLDAGVEPASFAIDAIDLSARAIDHARRGCYGRNAFRGTAIEFRGRYFAPAADGWLLDERVRACVQFRQGNLVEPDADTGMRYDFVFCRNVLIYFDRDAQDRVIASLENLLADDGMLFVGPAETGVAMRHGMQSARIPLAFAFRRARADAVAANAYAARRASMASGPPPYRRAERASVAPLAATRSVLSVAPPAWNGDGRQPFAAPLRVRGFDAPADMHADTAAPADDGTAPTLEHAQALANAGAFDEAERVLAQFSARVGPHADAFYLNGLIADARGRAAEAGDYYRKALYLRPTHHEALTHLATLLDVGGDRAGAQWLLERARRSAG
ncbi:MCP methyltransferase [Burkholderia dolosa]|uniref:MCP methyltransferase n=1 Tax=Burkholderia dolosa TaxID=152500 RepID=A0A892IBZ4_9BURK|nr:MULTISPECIES: CheR family methyltransferase [Burkholderia]AKE05399.1 MCP methyltransferase [Burkholderia cepacia]AJY09808.1 cheR methyltransferase, SAM binding domain protein [Burkholderia dolosa AU0158]AYZ94284.1 MCP methyltransferase [Burkholderia dolosa]ETP61970.1 MCP methyltransferase [Burkholderia dolosa PC543]MBR8420253.1 MCP methyltransferase [Burkholderia dolosa]